MCIRDRDGSIQGFLEVLKMPYVGCGILASSVAMDKITTKRVLESAGIPQVPYVAVVEGDDIDEKIAAIEATLSYPVFTKPSNMGSVSYTHLQRPCSVKAGFEYQGRLLRVPSWKWING